MPIKPYRGRFNGRNRALLPSKRGIVNFGYQESHVWYLGSLPQDTRYCFLCTSFQIEPGLLSFAAPQIVFLPLGNNAFSQWTRHSSTSFLSEGDNQLQSAFLLPTLFSLDVPLAAGGALTDCAWISSTSLRPSFCSTKFNQENLCSPL
jgi:hypothetical protein